MIKIAPAAVDKAVKYEKDRQLTQERQSGKQNCFLAEDYRSEIDDVGFYKASPEQRQKILGYIRDEFIKSSGKDPYLMKNSMLFSDDVLGGLIDFYTWNFDMYNWTAAKHIVREHAKDLYSSNPRNLFAILHNQEREGTLTLYSTLPGRVYIGSSPVDPKQKTYVKEKKHETTKLPVISIQELSDLLAA